MKKIALLSIALLSLGFSFGQEVKRIAPIKKSEVALSLKTRPPIKHDVVPVRKLSYVGNFVVSDYHILSLKVPDHRTLEKINGSVVKVAPAAITGTELDPMTFNIIESQVMTRGEYVTFAFGRELKVREPNLPDQVLVHKTDHPNCKGFVEIDRNHIAVPYKGVLLFLERQ